MGTYVYPVGHSAHNNGIGLNGGQVIDEFPAQFFAILSGVAGAYDAYEFSVVQIT